MKESSRLYADQNPIICLEMQVEKANNILID